MPVISKNPILTIRDAEQIKIALTDRIDWESFYTSGTRNPPFFTDVPDENLVEWFEQGRVKPGSAVDLGCGNGRNAVYLAKAGCRVDAIDLSDPAIEKGRSLANEAGVSVNFIVGSIFDGPLTEYRYDFAYDGGLLHHLQPHRRPYYLDSVRRALEPDGAFGMTCFDTTAGVPKKDWEIYEDGSMPPGIGYSEDRLRRILQHFFEIVEFRSMKVQSEDSGLFGMDGLWAVLMKPLRRANM